MKVTIKLKNINIKRENLKNGCDIRKFSLTLKNKNTLKCSKIYLVVKEFFYSIFFKLRKSIVYGVFIKDRMLFKNRFLKRKQLLYILPCVYVSLILDLETLSSLFYTEGQYELTKVWVAKIKLFKNKNILYSLRKLLTAV